MKTVLLLVTIFLLMSTVGVYAGAAINTGPDPVQSASSQPLIISWTFNGGLVDGVVVTWTPVAEAVYTIQATAGTTSGGSTGIIITPLTSTSERTDVVPILGVKPEDLDVISVSIVES